MTSKARINLRFGAAPWRTDFSTQVQKCFLAEQAVLIDSGFRECPKCGAKLSKYGFVPSKFHAVFSDQLRLQKHCRRIQTVIGKVHRQQRHGVLAPIPIRFEWNCNVGKGHCKHREAQDNLEKLSCQRRSVNNRPNSHHQQVGGGYLIQVKSLRTQRSYPSLPRSWLYTSWWGHIPTKDRANGVLKLCLV